MTKALQSSGALDVSTEPQLVIALSFDRQVSSNDGAPCSLLTPNDCVESAVSSDAGFVLDVTSTEDEVELVGWVEDIPVSAVDALIEVVSKAVELADGIDPVPSSREQPLQARDADSEIAK